MASLINTLKVTGWETIEITDPEALCGRRKKIDKSLLEKLKGQTFPAPVLKQMFGYAQSTWLEDTQLKRHIERVKSKNTILWRVK
ncbi:hypothetical protein ES703_66946 [subsurface metagenome]